MLVVMIMMMKVVKDQKTYYVEKITGTWIYFHADWIKSSSND